MKTTRLKFNIVKHQILSETKLSEQGQSIKAAIEVNDIGYMIKFYSNNEIIEKINLETNLKECKRFIKQTMKEKYGVNFYDEIRKK